jgi:hypothetical protein
MSRNGKIAHLPGNVRDELNQRLENGEEGATLLPWLNALPEVQEASRTTSTARPSANKTSPSGARAGSANGRLARN